MRKNRLFWLWLAKSGRRSTALVKQVGVFVFKDPNFGGSDGIFDYAGNHIDAGRWVQFEPWGYTVWM